MAVIRVCALCESSCPDEHVYKIKRNLTLHVCETCWTIIRAIIDEYDKEKSKPKIKSKTPSKTKDIGEVLKKV